MEVGLLCLLGLALCAVGLALCDAILGILGLCGAGAALMHALAGDVVLGIVFTWVLFDSVSAHGVGCWGSVEIDPFGCS